MGRPSEKMPAEQYLEAMIKLEDAIIKLDNAGNACRKALRLMRRANIAAAVTEAPKAV